MPVSMTPSVPDATAASSRNPPAKLPGFDIGLGGGGRWPILDAYARGIGLGFGDRFLVHMHEGLVWGRRPILGAYARGIGLGFGDRFLMHMHEGSVWGS